MTTPPMGTTGNMGHEVRKYLYILPDIAMLEAIRAVTFPGAAGMRA